MGNYLKISVISLCKYFILLTFLLLGNVAGANHLIGGEINYQFVSASGNAEVYKVVLTLFADCGSGGTDAFQALVDARPAVRLFKGNSQVTSERIAYEPQGSDIEITPVCPDEANNTSCTDPSNLIPGIKQYVYVGYYTIPEKSDNWRFVFDGIITANSVAGRSAFIGNAEIIIPNTMGSVSIMYLEAQLNNTVGPNSSTTFTSIPTPFFCLNKPATYSLGAADTENDSLHFSLVSAKGTDVVQTAVHDIDYIPPFSGTSPLPTAPGNFNINEFNGQMNFIPDSPMICIVTNIVEEFRNGIRVGSSMREMGFVILDNCDNDPPETTVGNVTNANVNVDGNGNIILSVCEGQMDDIMFDVNVTDANNDNIVISSSNLPVDGQISVDNNGSSSPVVHFTNSNMELSSGSYIFYLTYTDDGCPLSYRKTVAYTVQVVPHPFSFSDSMAPACVNNQDGAAWVLPQTGITELYNYRWVDSLGNEIRNVNSQFGDTATNLAAGTYKVYARNESGCGKNIIIQVEQVDVPVINLRSDTTLCEGIPLELSVAVKEFESYRWNTDAMDCCITVNQPGSYTVTVTNNCGSTTEEVTIDYVKCNFCLFVPNAFTPNNDGNNDVFKILETCLLDNFKLEIFNRWGQLLFTTLSTAKSWDGEYRGKPVESGTYYYHIKATPTDKSKGLVDLKGDISLIR